MIKGNTTYVDLLRLKPPKKWSGNFFQQIHHPTLISTIMKTIDGFNWATLSHSIGLSKNHTTIGATFQVDIPNVSIPNSVLCLGVLNSNSGRSKLQFYGGVISTNGIVLYKDTQGKKHTTGTDLTEVVKSGLESFRMSVEHYSNQIERLQKQTLTPEQYNSLILYIGRGGIIPWSRLSVLDKYFHTGDNTAWRLLNILSLVIHRGPPEGQLSKLYHSYETIREESYK